MGTHCENFWGTSASWPAQRGQDLFGDDADLVGKGFFCPVAVTQRKRVANRRKAN